MSWSRAKKLFKKRKQKREESEVPYKLEPNDFLPHNMKVHTKFVERLGDGKFRFEVNGVVVTANNIIEAQRKYLRQQKPNDKEKFIRFLKDHHTFWEFKREIAPLQLNDLKEFEDGGAWNLLGDGCIFFHKNAVTNVNWAVLDEEWKRSLA